MSTPSMRDSGQGPYHAQGQILAERYQLLEQVGQGGMAFVYRAYDMRTGHNVAVKILRPDLAQDKDYVNRFQREAEAASKMTHHNIVNLLDVGIDHENRYLVMEYVEGKTLKAVIQERGRILPVTAAQITIRILSALQHAHDNGIIHRDIKPQNILVNSSGLIKVADFGIARIADSVTITKGDIVMGSVHYFSPEQASGQTVDARSDIYSVGVVLYEMLTGDIPFKGENHVAVAMQHIHNRPAPIESIVPDVPPAIAAVCMKAMSKNPKYRYQNARDMAADLRLALDGRTPSVPMRPEVQPVRKTEGTPVQSSTDGHVTESRRRRPGRMRIILTVVGTALVLGLLTHLGLRMYDELMRMVDVPDFITMDAESARRQAERLGLKVQIREVNHPSYAVSVVALQSPEYPYKLVKGDTVILGVSKGPASQTVPGVEGRTVSDAIAILQAAGLTMTVTEQVVSKDVEEGFIVSQAPAAGTTCGSGDLVQVTVSGGLCVVPEIVGKTFREARSLIESAGLVLNSSVEIVLTDDPALHDLVRTQSVQPGMQVIRGTQVSLAVYQVTSMTHSVDVTLDIPESQGLISVRVTLMTQGGEIAVFQEEYPSDASRHPTVSLVAPEGGNFVYRVYCNDRFAYQQEVVLP